MMLKIVALVFLLAVISCSADESIDEKSLKKDFDRLDEYLSSAVASDDREANLDEAAKWLDELEAKSVASKLGLNKSLKKALELFLSLRTVINSADCDDSSRELVDKIDEASGHYEMHRGTVQLPVRRVNKIVYHVAKEFYDRCYPDTVSPKVDQLGAESRCYINKLGDILKRSTTFLNEKYVGGAELVQVIQDHNLGKFGCDSSNQVKANPLEVTREEFSRYIVEPCKELGQVIGGDFRRYISRDFPFYGISQKEYSEIHSKRTALQYCPFIVDNEEKVWGNMVTYMSKNPKRYGLKM